MTSIEREREKRMTARTFTIAFAMSNNMTARLVSSRDLSIGGRNFIVSRLLSWDVLILRRLLFFRCHFCCSCCSFSPATCDAATPVTHGG